MKPFSISSSRPGRPSLIFSAGTEWLSTSAKIRPAAAKSDLILRRFGVLGARDFGQHRLHIDDGVSDPDLGGKPDLGRRGLA
jgi:hypothetical protein